MTPCRRKTLLFCFFQQLPRLCLGPLKGFFKADTHCTLSRALDSPRALLSELQRYKDTVGCAAVGAEVPRHRQEQLTQTLMVRLLKTHLSSPILDCKKSTE